MNPRISWWLRRHALRRKFGLSSHWSSMVYADCTLEGDNYVGKATICQASTFGRFTYVNNSTKVLMTDIGRFSCVGPECLIGGLGAHPMDRLSTHRMFYSRGRPEWTGFCKEENFLEKQRTSIGHDVWIGARAVVMDGVRIGDGAVIAAGSVITKDVPPYAIVGGVPAKIIRHRFGEELIQQLLIAPWWDDDLATLRSRAAAGEFTRTLAITENVAT